MYGNDPYQVRTKGRGNSFYSFYKLYAEPCSCSNRFDPLNLLSGNVWVTRLVTEFLDSAKLIPQVMLRKPARNLGVVVNHVL